MDVFFFWFPRDWSIACASFLILTFPWLLATDHMSFVPLVKNAVLNNLEFKVRLYFISILTF